MRVAFDLDNTLLRSGFDFPTEKPTRRFLSKFLAFEELRKGTLELFAFCKQQNWETWIYTTSFRSRFYIRRLFWLYGIWLNGVVNQETHNSVVSVRSSKHPPSFGLDVIIDDSEGVKMEGKLHHFHTIWIKPDNMDWVADVKNALLAIQTS